MIRVLQFADVINRYDFIDTLVEYADPDRFEMSVCLRSEEHGIARPLEPRSGKRRLIVGTSRASMPAAAFKLSRLLRDWNIDVLHTHHYDQAIIGWLATRLSPATKLVVGRHYSDSLYRIPSRVKSKAFLAAEGLVNSAATRIIVPSQMIYKILTERQGVDPNKIDIVHYGFVPEKYSAISPQEIAAVRKEFSMDGRFVVANFSRLHEEKGHRYLVDAAAKLIDKVPNLLVLLVGEGPERARIEDQIARLGVGENVKLTGWRTDAMAIMAAAEAVAQSTLQEAFSQAMIETMWMSKPLVMTDVSGARDVIASGENGLLVPPGDPQALGDAISKLAADAELARKLAANAHDYVANNLVISKKIKEYEQVFQKAAASNA